MLVAAIALTALLSRRPAPQPARAAQSEYFIALDDSPVPINLGTIERVNLPASWFDPSQPATSSQVVPAEVVLGDDGRPRAIRFLH